jgi:hypothetical protein
MKNHFLKLSIILIVALAIITACKPLPIRDSKYVTSLDKIAEMTKSLPYSHYDPNSKIRYDIYNTDSLLILRFDVSDELSIFKIISFGLEIYIDTTSNQKKREGYIYPIAGAFQQNSVLNPVTGPINPKLDNSNIQNQLKPIMILIHNDEENQHNLFAIDSPLDIFMNIDKNQSLSYEAHIPLSEFGLKPNSTLSLGIITGDIPEKEEDTNEDVNMQNNYNSNNPDPMYRPPYGNRPGGAQPMTGNDYAKEKEPIKLWFKLNLNDKTIN